MNTAEVIALGALIVAALGFVFNRRKDVTQSASDFARVDAQLGSIKSGVDDIRVEIRSLRSQISGLSERVSKLEGRINILEKEVFKNE